MDYKKLLSGIKDGVSESWIEEYDNAPTLARKKYMALTRADTVENLEKYFSSREEYRAELKRLLDEFTLEDWKHAYKYSGNNPWRLRCKKEIERLEKQD